MHLRVFEEFERICGARNIDGRVLEVGAVAHAGSLLNLKALSGASHKIGIDLNGGEYADYKVVAGNANDMPFEDAEFDVVLCNATLEHDPFFWKTAAEIKRVAKPGGFVVVGVPGYARARVPIKAVLRRLPLTGPIIRHPTLGSLLTGTSTFHVHNHPGDYYRFSPQAMSQVLLGGLADVEVGTIMRPPRVIGRGLKPAA